jgi:HSP20 family protein
MEDFMTGLFNTERFFEDLFDVRREFDEMFNRMLTTKPWNKELNVPGKIWNFMPAVESYVDKDAKKYICRVALPGIDPKEVEINVQGNLLTIRGERKLTHKVKEVELWEEEITYGKFERILTLPEGVLPEKFNAEFVNGVLEITAPVAVAALPRKIEIKTTPFVKQIAA